jgi:hypothetical protein
VSGPSGPRTQTYDQEAYAMKLQKKKILGALISNDLVLVFNKAERESLQRALCLVNQARDKISSHIDVDYCTLDDAFAEIVHSLKIVLDDLSDEDHQIDLS